MRRRNSKVVKKSGFYSHVEDTIDQTIRFVKTDIKRAAETNQEALGFIIAEAVVNLPTPVQAALPLKGFLMRTIRNQGCSTPPEPQILSDFDIPTSYNAQKDENSTIMLGTNNSLNLLASSEKILADGTF